VTVFYVNQPLFLWPTREREELIQMPLGLSHKKKGCCDSITMGLCKCRKSTLSQTAICDCDWFLGSDL